MSRLFEDWQVNFTSGPIPLFEIQVDPIDKRMNLFDNVTKKKKSKETLINTTMLPSSGKLELLHLNRQ